MRTERTVAGMRAAIAAWRESGDRVALVPTMGALHEGHLSLAREARHHATRVVVSIFVNPTQFGPHEDFSRYPRNEAADVEALVREGVDLLYAPTVPEMYPDGFCTTVTVAGLDTRWEGEIRPGHFAGVATVVAKLLTQAGPDAALFGEKDYQQLQVIRRLARDLDLPARIVGCPTMRDAEGLALSSRNAYLSEHQIGTARQLNRLLASLSRSLSAPVAGSATPGNRMAKAKESLGIAFDAVDYLAVVDPETLEPLSDMDRPIRQPARILAAVRLGSVRLLDNMAVALPEA